jgi:hypothetical protein
MTMILDKAANQLKAAGIYVKPPRENFLLGGRVLTMSPDNPYFPEIIDDDYFVLGIESGIWFVQIGSAQRNPIIKAHSDLAVSTQAVQDFYVLNSHLDYKMQHELTIMFIRIQWELELVIDICDANTLRIRVPIESRIFNAFERALLCDSLVYSDEIFHVHVGEHGQCHLEWSFEGVSQLMIPFVRLDEIVPILRLFCGHPRERAARPLR